MKDTAKESDPLVKRNTQAITKFIASLKSLGTSPRDLWIMFTVKLLGFAGFSVLTISSSLYFTEVLGFTDMEMGLLFAAQGMISGVFTLLLGSFPDRYGIRFSLLFANANKFFCYLILIFWGNQYVQVSAITFLAIPSAVISVPTTKLAVKRYTSHEAKSIGYSTYYVILFGSAAVAAVLTDIILSVGGINMATFRYTFAFGGGCVVSAFFLTFLLRELDFSVTGEQEVPVEPREKSMLRDTRDILVLKSFWRFMVLTLLLVFVRSVYSHINITMPLYMTRDIGEDAHFGYMIALHEIVTLVCTPLLTMLIYYFTHYSLFVIGGVACAASPLVFLVDSSYLAVAAFVVISSLGEGIHAPRLLDYTIDIAPNRKEGIFLAISAIPLMMSPFITGLTAGFLLNRYCPKDGERECWKMWGIISCISFLAVFFVFLSRRWIEQPKEERNPYLSFTTEGKAVESANIL